MTDPVVTLAEARRMAREIEQLRDDSIRNRVRSYREGVGDYVALLNQQYGITPGLSRWIENELIGEEDHAATG